MTFKNQRRAKFSLRAVTIQANTPQVLTGYEPKFTKFVVVVKFSSTVWTQQSSLRSVHPLSNERDDIKKEIRKQNISLPASRCRAGWQITHDSIRFCKLHVRVWRAKERLQILPRDAMLARGICYMAHVHASVRLSVHLSDTFQYSVKTVKHIIRQTTSLVFRCQRF